MRAKYTKKAAQIVATENQKLYTKSNSSGYMRLETGFGTKTRKNDGFLNWYFIQQRLKTKGVSGAKPCRQRKSAAFAICKTIVEFF